MRIYHGRDLRKGRCAETGRPYLLTTVTHDRRPIFRDRRLGRLVVRALRDAQEAGHAETLAWVLMPDHLHWLVAPASEPLDALMRRIKSCSARAINQQQKAAGPVWQRGYHDHALRREENLQTTARYIIANPLRAGIVRRIGDYPLWDSVYL